MCVDECVCVCVWVWVGWCLGVCVMLMCHGCRHCQHMREKEDSHPHSSSTSSHLHGNDTQRKQLKPDSYFSDEDASD